MAGLIWLWQGAPLTSADSGGGGKLSSAIPFGQQLVDYSQFYRTENFSPLAICRFAFAAGLL